MPSQVEGLVAKGYAKDEITKWRWYTGATILVCNGEGFAKRQNMVEQNPDAKGLCRKAMVIHAKASDAVSADIFSILFSLHKCQKLRNLESRALHGITIDSFVNPLPFYQ